MYFGVVLIGMVISNAWPVNAAAAKPGWKILINHFGWSIQYPGNWALDEGDGLPAPASAGAVLYGTIDAEKLHQQMSWVAIHHVRAFNQKYSLKEIVEGTHGSSPALRTKGGHETKIAGFPAYDEIVTEQPLSGQAGSFVLRKIAINKNGELFEIEYNEGGTGTFIGREEWKYEKVFNEMLSTFRFTK